MVKAVQHRSKISQNIKRGGLAITTFSLGWLLTSCAMIITTKYEATALTTYTWQVEYVSNPDKPIRNRREKFASTSLLNRNGKRPDDAVTGPDDQGLWWPAIPPRPTVDEIEAEKRSQDQVGSPKLIKSVDYSITYEDEGKEFTLPTNYSVYRQVVKAYPNQTPLELTIAADNRFVTKADPR
ncbi:MAG TPA: hypothetical protein V6C65_16190 [Allocoleopsis sp.]